MKLNRFFMLGLAGLAFAACSNEEEMSQGQNLDGNGSVTVKIVAINVKGTIYVKLSAAVGSDTQEVPADGGMHTLKFYGVKSPSKVEAWVNDGDTKALGTTNIDDLQILPEQIPAYGSTTDIKLTGQTETVEQNGNSTTYEMYEASVNMKIPVARLEVSGIKHATHSDGDVCKYSELSIDGIYLDKVKMTADAVATDYSMPAGSDGTPAYPILFEDIAKASFLDEGAVWPAVEGQVYAFNFYTGTMPILKIFFEDATASDDNNPVSHPRYAVIKSYNGDTNFNFEAGHVYRITDVTLEDNNIIGDEEGNALYGVTVTEASWSVTDITGEWVEQ